ncbi:MAG: HEAT repeat domain-containing protein [Spirochaetes bacterium]|nr:HEAT repeat domain-containing protein [Spirochaetota bacterium]
MKKIVIIIAMFFIAAAFVNAQETGPIKEAETEIEEASQEAAVEEATETAIEEIEKKVDEKAKPKEGKEGYIADLSSNDENKIIAAAEWLGEKEEKSAVPDLVKLLKNDKRVKVRMHATIALGLIADESCIPALNEALTSDSNADVRYSVLLAIHRIDPSKSLDAIKKAKETESDPYVLDYLTKMEAKWFEKK